MKKNVSRIASLLLSASLLATLLAGCGGGTGSGSGSGSGSNDGGNTDSGNNSSSGQTYNLTFSIHDPAASAKTQKYEALAAATKEATNGAVDITVFPGGTLLASTDVAEGVVADTADMGWLFTTFFPGQFPLTEVVCLPMLFEDNVTATNVLLDLYENSPELQNELSAYKVFNLYCNPINYLYSNKPINTVDDMKGQQLRATAGVATDMVMAWGGSPIPMGPGDMYQAIEKGTLDGCVFEWSGFDDFSLYEVVKYCTEVPALCGVFMTVMNQEKFNSLPAEYQEIMDEIWGDRQVSVEFAEVFMADFPEAYEHAEAAGMEIITPDDATLAGFQVAANEYIDQWVDSNSTGSIDAQAYLDLMMEYRSNY